MDKTTTDKREVADERPPAPRPIICESCTRAIDIITGRCGCFHD